MDHMGWYLDHCTGGCSKSLFFLKSLKVKLINFDIDGQHLRKTNWAQRKDTGEKFKNENKFISTQQALYSQK